LLDKTHTELRSRLCVRRQSTAPSTQPHTMTTHSMSETNVVVGMWGVGARAVRASLCAWHRGWPRAARRRGAILLGPPHTVYCITFCIPNMVGGG